MSKTYTLTATAMNGGRKTSWSNGYWEDYSSTDTCRAGVYSSNFYCTNMLFNTTALASLKNKTIQSIKLKIYANVMPTGTSNVAALNFKYNASATGWTRGDNAGNKTTTAKAYINETTFTSLGGNWYQIDLTSWGVPTYGYVAGPRASSSGAQVRFDGSAGSATNKAELTIVTNENDYSYTLVYNANGGSGVPGIQTGTAVAVSDPKHTFTISSTEPTRTGYTFLGWSISASATTASYSAGSSISCSAGTTTLYAVWKAITYTVSYNANGGSGVPSNQTKIYGQTLILSTRVPTFSGYTFSGWNTKADGSGTSYNPGGDYDSNEPATLYAQWTPNTYKVTYNPNGGSGSDIVQSVSYNAQWVSDSGTTISRIGYVLLGWSYNEVSSTVEIGLGLSQPQWDELVDATLYAVWSPISYIIVYDGNGNTAGTMPNETFTYDLPKKLSANLYTKPPYKFSKWKDLSSNKTYSDQESVINLSNENGSTATLTAQWVLDGYEISIQNPTPDAIDVSGGGAYLPGESCTLFADSKNVVGYTPTFIKWTSSNASVVPDSTNNPYTFTVPSQNITMSVVAELTPHSYAVKYDGNGASSGLMENSEHTYGTPLNLSANLYKRKNYVFDGWSTTRNGAVEYSDQESVSNLTSVDGGEVILYAIWRYDQMLIASAHNKYLHAIKYGGTTCISLQWLNPDGSVAFDIAEDAIDGGTLNVSNMNGIRRTASISLNNWLNIYDVNVNKIWFGQQIRLLIGRYDEDGNPHLIPNGVFYVSDPSIVENPANSISNLNLVDKWAFLDGSLNGKLGCFYRIWRNVDLRVAITELLLTDRGNGYPIDYSPPIFDHTVDPFVVLCPYDYKADNTGTYANVLTDVALMMECSVGYNENGNLELTNIQYGIRNYESPVLWDFSPDEIVLTGMSKRAMMTRLYNDIIVSGGVLNGAIASGRATDTSPSSSTNIYRIGYKTQLFNENKYYSDSQCKGLAEYYLSENSRLRNEKTFQSIPLYHLKPNNLVSIRIEDGELPSYYLINSLSIPLSQTGQMSIQATNVDVLR